MTEDYFLYLIILIGITVLISILVAKGRGVKGEKRTKPGDRLRDNMRKMRKEAPFKRKRKK